MNFRKNNGFAGVDISISMIIILIFILTIFGVVYNIQKMNTSANREAKAISIATDILEIAKSEAYDEVTLENSNFIATLNQKYTESSYTNSETQEPDYQYVYYSAMGENEEHYQIQIGIKNYYPSDIELEEQEDLVKIIKVLVIYPVGNNQKTIDISTVLQNT